MDTSRFTQYCEKVVSNCSRVIVGKDDVIRRVLTCFVCSGHVLLEDVPGTGKTMLLRAFAKTVGGDFKRIQFTPDLLPFPGKPRPAHAFTCGRSNRFSCCTVDAIRCPSGCTCCRLFLLFFIKIASLVYRFQKYHDYFPDYLPISPLLFLFFLLK